MTIDKAVKEWATKKRRMGCNSATAWFCKRVPGFHPIHIERYTSQGEVFGHTVATNGRVIVDLAPYADRPRDD